MKAFDVVAAAQELNMRSGGISDEAFERVIPLLRDAATRLRERQAQGERGEAA